MLTTIAIALTQANPQVEAAYGVLQRTIGPRAREMRLQLTPPTGNVDRFSFEAKNGKVTVTGTSGVAICRGAYTYLKERCNTFASWEAVRSDLPKTWPDAPKEAGSSLAQWRHYYNICTFGYTTAFWDWKRWEREVDWMALHGINMPLAMNGQDKIWQKVFLSFGLPQSSIDKFFVGPAFQPWHWMGNINEHMGPPPQSWISGQADLQKKILARERSLGMKPVVPGFSGFVPVDFAKYQPKVKLQSPTAWAGFKPTTFVDIRDPMFVEIGKRFVQEYRKEFGTDHLYLCDTFNEQNPQFPEATKLADLANAGHSVYEGLKQGDPDAIWVMQGWLFYNERNYWHEPEITALLSKVPDSKMIILDLSGEQYEVWKQSPAVAKKGFIWNTLHNFGQNTGLGGDLQGYVDKERSAVSLASRSAPNTNLLGLGLTPEGIDQNPVVYELMCDSMWRNSGTPSTGSVEPISVQAWLNGYCLARYRDTRPPVIRQAPQGNRAAKIGELQGWQRMMPAWQMLHTAVYSKDSPWFRDSWRGRPGRGRRGRPIAQMRQIEMALQMMIEAGDQRKNPLYQRDLVDVCKTWMGGIADRMAYLTTMAHTESPASYALLKRDFFEMLDDLDQVLACRPEHRLSTWIAQARAWGKTPEEKSLFEKNARMQVTAWDGQGVLTDYANKEWAGLTKDFIAKRWELYFRSLEEAKSADFLKLEMDWVNSSIPPKESKPGDAYEVVSAMMMKYAGAVEKLEKAIGVSDPPGNLARAGKASDDGHTEAGGSAQNAIDGDLDTYWAASPYPCTWQVDLGEPKTFKKIQVFPYWGDGRYYQYVIETSTDGFNWTQRVDMSTNSQPSSMSGHTHNLAQPTTARYMRIRILKNSANVGVHLVEVRIFP